MNGVSFIKLKSMHFSFSDKANERASVKTIRNTNRYRIPLPFSSFFFFSPLGFPRLFLGAIFHSFGIEKTIKVSGTKYKQKKHKLGYSYNRLLRKKIVNKAAIHASKLFIIYIGVNSIQFYSARAGRELPKQYIYK